MPSGTEQYADFLAGVRSTTWLRSNGGDTGASLGAPPSTAPSVDATRNRARIAGVAVGALISLTLTLLGLLMLSGAIAFARQIIVEPSPPPPPPPPPPPRPSRPPLAASQVLLERPACQVEVAGAFVSRVGNKICEDGGEGSESSDCPFG